MLAGSMLRALGTAAGLLVAASAAPACGPAPSAPSTPGGELAGASVLVTLIDACAADHVSALGYERPTTPFLERLARESVVFADATSAAPYTLASVASLMTGEVVDRHGVTEPGDLLPADLALLAEAFRAAGYRTAAASTNMRVHARFGFDRGFDSFELVRPDVEKGGPHVVPPKVLAALARTLERGDGRPLFAYWHFMPPHAPYDPPEAQRRELAGGLPDARAGSIETLKPFTAGAARPSPELARAIVDLYDASVLYADSVLERVHGMLADSGRLDDTLWIVLSDHGEAFGQHGVWQHSGTVYEEMLRVPLLVRLPGGKGGGRVAAAPVSLADVFATLRELCALPAPAPATSASFAALLLDPSAAAPERPVPLLARTAGPGPHRALRRGDLKLVHRAGEKRYELYDLAQDPEERRDLSRERPEVVEELAARLRDEVRAAERLRRRAERIELDEELRRELAGFGYVGDDAEPDGD